MKIIGHRGAKGHISENTLASFEKAIALGCHGIELDVLCSKDHKLLVFHDEHLERLCGVSGNIQDFSFEELRSMKVQNSHQIPTLIEVLDLSIDVAIVNIELKTKAAVSGVEELIRNYLAKGVPANHFLVSSFDWVALKDFRSELPEIPVGVLCETDLNLAIEFAKTIQAEAIHPHFHLLTSENTNAIKNHGFQINTWTVNEPEDIANLKNFGVDSLITDFPDLC